MTVYHGSFRTTLKTASSGTPPPRFGVLYRHLYYSTPIHQFTHTQPHTHSHTQDGKTVYAISFKAPTPGIIPIITHHTQRYLIRSCAGVDFILKRAVPTSDTQVTLLGYETPLQYNTSNAGLNIKIPPIPFGELLYAWTFKLTNLG